MRDEPYRERSWEQLVVALYRAGRQGDALGAYQRARSRMVDDLGIEPRPSLRALERHVLDQDPSLLPASLAHVTVLSRGVGSIATDGAAVLAVPPPAVVAESVGGFDPQLVGRRARVPIPRPHRLRRGGRVDVRGARAAHGELAGRLVDNDFVVIAGASGAGKSSLLRAGLVPALRGGAIPGSAAWRIQVVTPSRLQDLLATPSGLDVLAVDQAEELFTITAEQDRRVVARRLGAALNAGTRLVLVLRADFYGRLTELEGFTNRIGAATVLVGAMTEEETRRVVIDPAARHGVSVAPALADRVVADVHGRSGALPLLSAALEQAWSNRTGDRLTEDAYRRGGGVSGVLESMGENAFGGSTPTDGPRRGACCCG